MKQKRGKRLLSASALMLTTCILLTGCSTETPVLEDNGESHVPTALEQYNGNGGMMAEDDRYYYLVTSFRLYAIDKETWEVHKACRDAMCTHEGTCAYSGVPQSVVNVKGNILLTYSDMFGYYSEKDLYLLNPVTMELESVYEDKFTMGSLQNMEDQLIYCWNDDESAKSGTQLLNVQTGEMVQLADKTARIRYDDAYYYVNTANEGGLYRLSKDLQEKVLLDNHQVSFIQLDGGYVYYTYFDSEYAAVTLGRMTKDRQEVERLVPGVWNWFHVYQGKVYYTEQKKGDLMVLDLDTEESTVLAECVSFMFYLIPGADKLIINQDGIYSCMNLDGSQCMELFYEPSEISFR